MKMGFCSRAAVACEQVVLHHDAVAFADFDAFLLVVDQQVTLRATTAGVEKLDARTIALPDHVALHADMVRPAIHKDRASRRCRC